MGYKIEKNDAHWRSVIEKLRLGDADAVAKFEEALEEASAPVLAEVQAAALAGPSHGAKHTGLRGRLAAGTSWHPDGGGDAAVKFEASNFLSRVTDNGPAGWRHPVYGNMSNWVHQDGWSWFKEVIEGDANQFENRLQAALEKLKDQID